MSDKCIWKQTLAQQCFVKPQQQLFSLPCAIAFHSAHATVSQYLEGKYCKQMLQDDIANSVANNLVLKWEESARVARDISCLPNATNCVCKVLLAKHCTEHDDDDVLMLMFKEWAVYPNLRQTAVCNCAVYFSAF